MCQRSAFVSPIFIVNNITKMRKVTLLKLTSCITNLCDDIILDEQIKKKSYIPIK